MCGFDSCQGYHRQLAEERGSSLQNYVQECESPTGVHLEREKMASSRKHYQDHPQEYKDRAIAQKKVLQELVDEIKAKPCMDCGGLFPSVCMDFDHRDPTTKTATIAKLIGNGSKKKLLEEIEKCDLVCSNCHRIRTFITNRNFSKRIS